MGKITDYFPFDEFRDRQEEVLNLIDDALGDDKNVVISASTGFGKSPVNLAACRWSGSAFYTTPLKHLQDQLNRDFSEYIVVIKGRGNYPCVNCNDVNTTAATADCVVKSNFKCASSDKCSYKVKKRKAQEANIVCTNTSYLMVVPQSDDRGGFDPRRLLVVDEAHGLDDWALRYITLTLYESDIGSLIQFNKFIDCVDWIRDVVIEKLLERYTELQTYLDGIDTRGKRKIIVDSVAERDRIISTVTKATKLIDDYDNNGEEWVSELIETPRGKSIQFKPITAGRFLQGMLWDRADKIILSSATILYPKIYLTDIGLDPDNTEVISIESTFPDENRPFYVDPIGKMNKDSRKHILPLMADRIIEIMDEHPDMNGIVHCHSYDNAEILYDELSDLCNDTQIIVMQDRDDRDGSLNSWIDSPVKSLFLSVNFTDGVDLKDDLCRYQVSVKVPYMYMGDKRVQARMNLKSYRCEKCGNVFRSIAHICPKCESDNIVMIQNDGEIWYAMKAIETLIQSHGRGVRSPDDWADYYMLDGSFENLYRRYNNKLFPNDFKRVIKYI